MTSKNKGVILPKRVADVAPGVVGIQGIVGVQPSTVGSSLAVAQAKRLANAGSSRRALKNGGISKETGFKVHGFMKMADACSNALKVAEDAKAALKDTGNNELEQSFEQLSKLALMALARLLKQGKTLLAQVQGEQAASRDAEYEAGGSGATGEVPHAGARAQDTAAVVLDMERMEATRRRANELLAAQNPARVHMGLADDPVTDLSQLLFWKPAAN